MPTKAQPTFPNSKRRPTSNRFAFPRFCSVFFFFFKRLHPLTGFYRLQVETHQREQTLHLNFNVPQGEFWQSLTLFSLLSTSIKSLAKLERKKKAQLDFSVWEKNSNCTIYKKVIHYTILKCKMSPVGKCTSVVQASTVEKYWTKHSCASMVAVHPAHLKYYLRWHGSPGTKWTVLVRNAYSSQKALNHISYE